MARLGGSTATRTVTLQNKTLTDPAINGTVTTTGLTMPGHTVGGDLLIANANGVVVGHTAQVTLFSASEFQVLGTAAEDAGQIIGRFSANTGAGELNFLKSRSATIGGLGIVASGDAVARIFFHADDGTDYVSRVGRIEAIVDGTPGENDTPGRIAIYTTPDGANTDVERIRWNAAGNTVLSGYLVLLNTDTDAAVEGALWFDESEKKLKFFNGSTVETVTSA